MRISAFLTAWSTYLHGAMTRTPAHARRGAGILEYVIVAAVVVGFAIVFREQLGSAVRSLVNRVTGGVNNVNSN